MAKQGGLKMTREQFADRLAGLIQEAQESLTEEVMVIEIELALNTLEGADED